MIKLIKNGSTRSNRYNSSQLENLSLEMSLDLVFWNKAQDLLTIDPGKAALHSISLKSPRKVIKIPATAVFSPRRQVRTFSPLAANTYPFHLCPVPASSGLAGVIYDRGSLPSDLQSAGSPEGYLRFAPRHPKTIYCTSPNEQKGREAAEWKCSEGKLWRGWLQKGGKVNFFPGITRGKGAR